MPQDYNAADAAFVRAMIPHHATAVEMAQRYLKTGQNTTIRQMAQAIVSGQNSEIATFRAWLRARGLSEQGQGMSRM